MAARWEDEWQALLRGRDDAVARTRELQAEITAAIRRREPLPMHLLRAAELAEGELAQAKARLRDFLHHLG